MFTWICPQCGREVPPSYTECPDCAAKGKAPATAPPDQPTAPPPPPSQPAAAPQRPDAPYIIAASRPPSTGLPTWLLSILFAFAFLGLFGGIYWLVERMRTPSASATSAPAAMETPAAKPKTNHPLQKYVEVAGIRLTQNAGKKTEAKFILVNHSGAEIADLTGTVNIWGRTAKSEEEPVGTFQFKIPSLGAYEAKEMTAPLNTKLRAYELPDWQNVTGEVQITSP